MRQFQIKLISGCLFALMAYGLSGCTQAPSLGTGDFDYGGTGSSGYDLSSAGALTVSPRSASVGPNGTLQLYVSGGYPPYAFTIVNGAGTLNEDNGFFTAANATGTVQVEVRDLRGNLGSVVIVVSGDVGSNQGGVGNGALNYALGVIGLSVGTSCTADTFNVGTIRNTTDARLACMNRGYVSATSTVVTDVFVTGGGAHAANPSCPSGYSTVGTTPDCFGGSCSGVQAICAKFAPVSAISKYVTNFYVTNGGSHSAAGPGCYSPYVNVGSVSDCEGGTCSGYQNFCKLTN